MDAPGTRAAASTSASVVVVAVLGRADQPVGGVERLGQARARPARPCARWPAPGARAGARGRPRPSSARVAARSPGAARRRRSRCRSWWRRCRASAICGLGEPVDGDVAPGRVVGRELGDVGPARRAATAGRGGAGRRRGRGSRSATTRAAGRFSGIVQRFSTTTRSAPARAASTSSPLGALGGAEREARGPGGRPGPRRPRCAPIQPSSREHARPRSRPPRTRRRDGRGGSDTRAAVGTAARYRRAAALDRRPRRHPRGGVAREADGGGFCVPNPTTYPWQWLWDSCFHAVVWAHLGDERAVGELPQRARRPGRRRLRAPHALRRRARTRTPSSGAGRDVDPSPSRRCTATRSPSCSRRGCRCPTTRRCARAARGLRFLLRRAAALARRAGRAVPSVGVGLRRQPPLGRRRADGGWTPSALVRGQGRRSSRRSSARPAAPRCATRTSAVGSVGFSALVAWNARELAAVTGDDELRAAADELAEAVDARWVARAARRGSTTGPPRPARDGCAPSTRCCRSSWRPAPEALRELVDPAAFGAPCGPAGVHLASPPTTPTRLLAGAGVAPARLPAVVASTSSADARARRAPCRGRSWPGVGASGFAEYWEPDTGRPLGAGPQSWTTLVVGSLQVDLAVGAAPLAGSAAGELPQASAAPDDDQVTEGQDLVRERNGQHVAQHAEPCRAGSRGGGARGGRSWRVRPGHHPARTRAGRPHRHPLVDGHRGQVQAKTETHHGRPVTWRLATATPTSVADDGEGDGRGGPAQEEGDGVESGAGAEQGEVVEVQRPRVPAQARSRQAG